MIFSITKNSVCSLCMIRKMISSHVVEHSSNCLGNAGAILGISLRVGVIPLSATTRRVFLTNFLSLYT